ncbi:MAG: NAD(+)/NADH kinase [Bacteroidales bacterium]|nr:NAD(+)/NADH kinase [Bacteroidales bacterium]
MKVALYYRHIDDADRPSFDALQQSLLAHGLETVHVADGDNVVGADYLFSIGGDGTLLSSVQFVGTGGHPASLPPIVGINFGHLGFLTTAGRADLDTLVDQLMQGHFSLERRTLLQVAAPDSPLAAPAYALNEVFLHRPEESSMLRTEVYVDGLYVATYAGDGVIVATPTGSTAYSLSCGGPILTPDSGSLVITPIGAHTLTLRPIIVPDSASLRLVVVPATHHTGSADPDPFTLGLDSRRATLRGAVAIDVCRAPFTINLVRMGRQNFFSAIRDKLMWGTEIRP